MNTALSLLLALVYSLLMAFKETFYIVDFLPLLCLAFLRWGGMRSLFKQLILVQLFLVFIVFGIGLLHGDWAFAWIVFVRSVAIVSFNLMLFWKRDAFAIYQGMEDLRIPFKLNLLLFFMLKYIEILNREFSIRREALKARGFVGKTDLHSYRTYAGILGMMIYHGFLRSERLNEALQVRGFRGRMYALHPNKTTLADFVLSGLIAVQFLWLLREVI